MIVDLHVHTSALSSCSSLDPEEAVLTARSSGLDAICFTEHSRLWPEAQLEKLSARYDFPVFCGMEVETREGHMLVFGLSEDQTEIMAAEELRRKVDLAGGVMIYAHPFRGFLMFGFSDLQMTIKEACGRKVFQMVDAVETFSGKSGKKENTLAQEVCGKLSIPGVGGSDAHSAKELGRCITIFNNNLRSTADLIEEIKKRQFRGGYPEK